MDRRTVKCTLCQRNILSHSLYLQCSSCACKIHRECIPLSRKEFKALSSVAKEQWICVLCLDGAVAFNHYSEEDDNFQELSVFF